MALTKILFYICDLRTVLLFTFIFLCSYSYIKLVWRKRNLLIKSWKFPGPFALPVVGNAFYFMGKKRSTYETMVKLQEKYPMGMRVWFGWTLFYFLHEPEHIERILKGTKFVDKRAFYKHIRNSIGEGLLTADPETWKKHRKDINPSFNQKVLDSFVPVFTEQSNIFTEVIEQNYHRHNFRWFEALCNCNLDIISETTMGLKLNVQRDSVKYGHILGSVMSLIFTKIIYIWNHVDFIWKLLGHDKELKGYLNKFNELSTRVIKEKMEAIEARKHDESSSLIFVEEEPSKRRVLLDYLIECEKFDASELRDEVNIFLFAGTDATAATLCFIFAVLGIDQDVQQKVFEEVIQVVGEDRMPEYKDLPLLTYTERVIKETLRLFPTAPLFFRYIHEDVDMGDFEIPKGVSTIFCMLYIHKNPKYWPDPLKFDPDRFLPEEVAKRHPCTYLPFSYGPRNCIGMKYGMMAMKVIITTVIRKFKIHSGYKRIEDIRVKGNFILRFAEGSKISMTPRK